MSNRPAVAELLHDLAAVMRKRRLPWYLFGAQAAIIWGSPRLSADADVTVQLPPSAVHTFVEAMKRHGFQLPIDDPQFITRTRVLPFVHRSGMPLDVVLGGPGLEEDFLRRSISVDVDGIPVPVISPEDLIVTKILAGRAKDVEDVRAVIHERRASLDVERIRLILGLLEQALAQGDLLPLFERLWSEEPSPLTSGGPTRKRRSTK